MNRLYHFFILVILFCLCGCRTMQLNQDAKILEKGTGESAIGCGIAPVGSYMGPMMGSVNLNLEYQQRFGVHKKAEVQFKIHHDVTFLSMVDYKCEADFGVKINTFDNSKYAFSLLPFIGVTSGIDNYGGIRGTYAIGFPFEYFINPNIGLMLIGSNTLSKHNFYWGGSINLMPNIIRICLVSNPSFDMDFTFNLGWEIPKDKVIYRHEIGFFFNYTMMFQPEPVYDLRDPNISFKDAPIYKYIYLPSNPIFSFGISYHFSAAFRYGKKNQKENDKEE